MVYNVCQSTCLPVSRMKWVQNNKCWHFKIYDYDKLHALGHDQRFKTLGPEHPFHSFYLRSFNVPFMDRISLLVNISVTVNSISLPIKSSFCRSCSDLGIQALNLPCTRQPMCRLPTLFTTPGNMKITFTINSQGTYLNK